MMELPSNGRPATLSEVLEGLKDLQRELDRREKTARDDLAKVLAERKTIDQMVAAAERTGRYSTKPKTPTQKGISEEAIKEVWDAIQKNPTTLVEDIPGSFSAKVIGEKVGLNLTTTRRAFEELRAEGRIRLVGERKVGSGRSTHLYVVDEH